MAIVPTPDIPTSNIGRAVDSIREFFARIRSSGGFVTTQQMVDSGLFDAALQPYMTPQPTGDDRIPPPQNVDATEQLYASSATAASVFRSRIIVDWNTAGPRGQYYELELWKAGVLFQAAQTPALEHIFSELDPDSYEIKIRTVGAFLMRSQAVSVAVVVRGKDSPPSPVSVLSLYTEDRWIRFSWVPLSLTIDPDYAGFKIKVRSTWGVDDEVANGVDVFTVGRVDTMLWAPNKSGTITVVIKAFDYSGNYSLVETSETIVISHPEFGFDARITAQIIDNNVLLSWPAAERQSYPLDHYEIRKGTDFESAVVIGEKSGTFTTIFETVSDKYKYWVAGVDTAGLYTLNPLNAYVSVSQPPDFILKSNLYLGPAWSGTKNNCLVDTDNNLLGLVNLTETFGEHFINNNWDQPSDQIAAGQPLFVQPGMTTAYYEEVIDYVVPVPSTKIILDVTRAVLYDVIPGDCGTVTVTVMISVKLNSGDAWTDYPDAYELYATNFQYVKYRISFASSDHGIIRVSQINARLEMKQKTYEGRIDCVETDVGGTTVDITGKFIDVTSIQVTPGGTSPAMGIYDFTDTGTPTSFRVLLFNTSGDRISGPASFLIRGV